MPPRLGAFICSDGIRPITELASIRPVDRPVAGMGTGVRRQGGIKTLPAGGPNAHTLFR